MSVPNYRIIDTIVKNNDFIVFIEDLTEEGVSVADKAALAYALVDRQTRPLNPEGRHFRLVYRLPTGGHYEIKVDRASFTAWTGETP